LIIASMVFASCNRALTDAQAYRFATGSEVEIKLCGASTSAQACQEK
jgi:hypothetical protein